MLAISLNATRVPAAEIHPYDQAASAVSSAIAAYQAEDYTTFRDQMLIANQHRRDHPTYRYYLAAAHALNGEAARAALVLQDLAALGLHVPAASQDDFAPIASEESIQNAFRALAANLTPTGALDVRHLLSARGGLWEGIAWDKSQSRIFISDLHRAEIHQVDTAGQVSLFTRLSTPGFGCGGLGIDSTRNLLWVSSPAMPEVAGFSEALSGQSQLVAFDLTTGRRVRQLPVPSGDTPHTVVDLTVAPDGTVFAADSTSPVVWTVAPERDEVLRFATIDSPGPRHSLQGTALSPEGNWLLVADYSTGLHAVSASGGESHLLSTDTVPHLGTLLGLDGIALHGNQLLAVQNGVSPIRLLSLKLQFDPSGPTPPRIIAASVAFSGQPDAADPTLVTLTPDAFLVIGNAGWAHFGANAKPDTLERALTIIQVPFDP